MVAQKFIAVVILMIIFLPALHFVELLGGIDTGAFQPDSAEAWGRGFFFWIGAISFYGGISLFMIALVDLVYAMVGIDNIEDSSDGDPGTSVRKGTCDTGSDSDVRDPEHESIQAGDENGKG